MAHMDAQWGPEPALNRLMMMRLPWWAGEKPVLPVGP